MKTLIAFILLCTSALAVDYPVIAVRGKRPDDTTLIRFAEVFNSVARDTPTDLVILKPDGTLSVLVSGNDKDALIDPKMSLDGKWCYYVRIPNTADRNKQRGNPVGAPKQGADIYRIHLETKNIVRVTGQNWQLPGSAGKWAADPSQINPTSGEISIGYGVINTGPCPLPGGRLAFTSNRRGYQPPKGYAFPNSQLFIIDDIPGTTDSDGEVDRNVECTGFLNVDAALHPTLLNDGMIAWSSKEGQGLRDRRLWSLWKSYPDGRKWGPIYSALSGAEAWHFHGQRTDGSLFSVLYYLNNNNGFGTLLESPEKVVGPEYLDPDSKLNPKIPSGWLRSVVNTPWHVQIGTQRRGLYSVTPWATQRDHAGGLLTEAGYVFKPKVTHPSPAPNNGVLVCISPGPANNLTRPVNTPRYHAQIGLIKSKVAAKPEDVEILLKQDGFNFTQPIAAVSWKTVYGSEPPAIPITPNPTGTPYGVVGSSSAHIGQWKPRTGNGGHIKQGFWTGIDVEEFGTEKIPAGIDIVGLSPVVAKTYRDSNATGWTNAIGNERARILARIRFDETGRTKGDTSWAAQIPADTPFTFRTFDKSGRTITFAQTWHQVRPGETRVDCGGCHNHSGNEVKWDDSWFVTSGQKPKTFDKSKVRTPEFNKDVLPIFKAKCWTCHGPDGTHPVKLDASIATSAYVVPMMAFKSRLSKAVHGEGDTAQMPLMALPLTAAEMLLIDEWIDYGCLVADPGKADYDESPPVVYVPRSGPLDVGVYDGGKPSITLNGVDVEATGSNGVWSTGKMLKAGDRVTVTVSDVAGNKTVVHRYVRGDVQPPQPYDPLPELKTLRKATKQNLDLLDEIIRKIEASK